MELEQEDIDFDRAVAKKRHDDLTRLLGAILTEFQKTPEDNGMKSEMKSHLVAIEKLISTLAASPKKESKAPIINVETNNDAVASSMKQIGDQISEHFIALKTLMEQPREHTWKFTRDRNGLILEVDAISKYK